MIALGDAAELLLQFFGITKNRVQAVTGKKDCGCARRQAAMNEWGYRWQYWLLSALLAPAAYRMEMLIYRIRYGRLGHAAMHFGRAVRVLLYGR